MQAIDALRKLAGGGGPCGILLLKEWKKFAVLIQQPSLSSKTDSAQRITDFSADSLSEEEGMARAIPMRPTEEFICGNFLLDMVWRRVAFELSSIVEQGLRTVEPPKAA